MPRDLSSYEIVGTYEMDDDISLSMRAGRIEIDTGYPRYDTFSGYKSISVAPYDEESRSYDYDKEIFFDSESDFLEWCNSDD